jgi:hypothetical protein
MRYKFIDMDTAIALVANAKYFSLPLSGSNERVLLRFPAGLNGLMTERLS